MENLLFFEVDESVLTEGQSFDGITAGTFTDMYGRKTTFRATDLPKYVENTRNNISATETEEGEVVGLPIDAKGHDKGDGAGWIVDVELDSARDVIKITPKWTEVGVELIKNKIRRFFSATIDVGNKVILGGTLTNYPAVRDRKGKILLKPINLEISKRLYEMAEEESVDEFSRKVRNAFYEEFGDGDGWAGPHVIEVFDGYLIASNDGKNFKVDFSSSEENGYTFSEEEGWTEVRHTWIEAALDFMKNLFDGVITSEGLKSALGKPAQAGMVKVEGNSPDELESNQTNTEVLTMDLTKEELAQLIGETVQPMIGEAVNLAVSEKLQTVLPTKPSSKDGEDDASNTREFDILKILDLENLKEETQEEVKQVLLDQYEAIRENAAQDAALFLAQTKREATYGEFSLKVTGGNSEVPYGVPAEAEELKGWLMSLNPDQAEFAMRLIGGFWKNGRTMFAELGHGKEVEGEKPLPEEYAKAIRSGEMKVEDLNDPLLALGDVSQYDLSEFKVKE